MLNYLKFRTKSYIVILLGFLIGITICEISFENPDYFTGVTFFLVGILIGEYTMIKKWLKEK